MPLSAGGSAGLRKSCSSMSPPTRCVRSWRANRGATSARCGWQTVARSSSPRIVPERRSRSIGADVRSGAVRTLVGTGPGAQFPAISPDGRRLVFVGYTADGYDLFSMPFDTPQWTDTPAPASAPVATAPDSVDPGAGAAADAPYRPWPTLAPRYWVPVVESGRDDVLVGASTSGFDALGRHAYVVTGTWAVQRNVPNWQADYSYSRWWPELFAGASDSTDDWRSGEVRSREVTAGVLLPVRRVRWTTAGLAAFQVSHDEFDCASCEPPVGATPRRWPPRSSAGASRAPEHSVIPSAPSKGHRPR